MSGTKLETLLVRGTIIFSKLPLCTTHRSRIHREDNALDLVHRDHKEVRIRPNDLIRSRSLKLGNRVATMWQPKTATSTDINAENFNDDKHQYRKRPL